MRRSPKPCYHRGQKRWYVTLAGKEHYLHTGQRPWTKALPADLMDEYNRLTTPYQAAKARQATPPPSTDPTVDEVWRDYLASPEAAKLKGDGKPTPSAIYSLRSISRVMGGLYGKLPARQFGADQLDAVQAKMRESDWGQRYLRQGVYCIRRVWAWAVRKKMLPASCLTELETVPTLGERDGVRQPEPVAHVPDSVIDETLPHLPATLQSLIRVHRLIGCRAKEICLMRPRDIERIPDPVSPTGELWTYRPDRQLAPKTKPTHWVGPKAQALLKPLLEGKGPDDWVFPYRGRRGRYTTTDYARIIRRVCARHGIPHWHPLQVRHAAAEEARRQHERGLEATQARLRHRHLATSEHYAHQLDQLGQDVARRLG